MENRSSGLMNVLEPGAAGYMSDLSLPEEGPGAAPKAQQEMLPGIAPQSQQMWNVSGQHGLQMGPRYPNPYGGTPSKQIPDSVGTVQLGTRMMGHYSGQYMGNMAAASNANQTVTYGYQGMSPRMAGQTMNIVQGGGSGMWSHSSPGSDKSSSSYTHTNISNTPSDTAGVRPNAPGALGKFVSPNASYLIQQSPSQQQRVAPFQDAPMSKNYHPQSSQLGSPPSSVSHLVPGSPLGGNRMPSSVAIPYNSQGGLNISFQNAAAADSAVQQGTTGIQQLNNGQYQFMACSPGGATMSQGMMGNLQVYGQTQQGAAASGANYRMGYSNTSVQMMSPGSSGIMGKQNVLSLGGAVRMNPASQVGTMTNAGSAVQSSGTYWQGVTPRQMIYQNGSVDASAMTNQQSMGTGVFGGMGSGQSVLIGGAGGQYTTVTPLYQGAAGQHPAAEAAGQQQQLQHHGYGMQQAQQQLLQQQQQHQVQQQHLVQQHQMQQHQMQQHQTQHQLQHQVQQQQTQQQLQQHQVQQQLQQHQVQQQLQQPHQMQQQQHQMAQQLQVQQPHQMQPQLQAQQQHTIPQQQQHQMQQHLMQQQQHVIPQSQHQIQQQLQMQQLQQHQLQQQPYMQQQQLQVQQLQQQQQLQQKQQQMQQQQQGQQHLLSQQLYFAQKQAVNDGTQTGQSLVILQQMPSVQQQQQQQPQPPHQLHASSIQPTGNVQMQGETPKLVLPQNTTLYVYNNVGADSGANSQICFSNVSLQMNPSNKEDVAPTAPLLHLPEIKPATPAVVPQPILPRPDDEPLSTPPPLALTDTEDAIQYTRPSYMESMKVESGFPVPGANPYDFPGDRIDPGPETGKKKRKRKPPALNEDGTPVKRKRKKKEVVEEAEDKPSSSLEPTSTLEPSSTIELSSTIEPSSSFEPEGAFESPEAKPKKTRKTPKVPKDPNAPKPTKTPKKPRTPKNDESGTPSKPKSSRGRKRKAAAIADEVNEVTSTVEMSEVVAEGTGDQTDVGETPVKEKPKPPPRPRPRKKRPLPTFLKNKKKKVSRSDNSDMERTPPASPVEDDNSQKRRSSRFTKRQKYLDDLDLNLSDEENASLVVEVDSTMVVKPVQFFVDNPIEEDAQIVEKILGVRMGKRNLNPPALEIQEPLLKKVNVEKKETDAVLDKSDLARLSEDDSDKTIPLENGPVDSCESPNPAQRPEGESPGKSEGTRPALEKNLLKLNEEEPQKSDEGLQTSDEGPQVSNHGLQKPGGPEKCGEDGPEESHEKPQKSEDNEAIQQVEVEEFYVKYKNFSYLHCEWRTADELELGDKRVLQKIKRHKLKVQQTPFYPQQLDEDDLFNPDYVEVDRILDMSVSTDPRTGEETTHYLVKWRALAYEDSTWELAQDVDKTKIETFLRVREPPTEDEREYKPRPSPKDWVSLDKCPTYKNGNTLREYQLEGLNWLTFCYYNKQNCILADEMGLGKTIQSISFVEQVFRYGIRGPFLIIVPLSTIGNWQREFEAWTDLNVIVYHGSTASRNMIQEYEMNYKDIKGKRIPDVCRFHVLITTYEVIISDLELLRQVDWRSAIIDEAHRLKNRNCKLLQGLNCFDVEHRVLLTGTPLQNNVEELFSLLSFLEPKQFASPETFMAEFGKLESEAQVDKLKALLKPMMLRRLKEDVEKSLAPKEETIIEVELTNIQKKYYRAILERNFSFLAKGGTSANAPNLMNTMMELRKCCNHPYLINGAEDQILEEFRVGKQSDAEKMFHTMVQSSGKLVLTDKLLPKLKADGHKVLIFSQMIRVLDIIEDYLVYKKYPFERIDGRIRGNLRQEAIDRFSKPDSDRFVFLLCTRAGGLGINLTAADTVIIYDSDWNPQNDLQAQARCHRIGQQKAVKVYRLITRNTYEREMFDRASMKLGLDKAVLQSMGPKDLNSGQLTKKEIEDLLKKGAYGALMEDDSTGNDFCEEDIEHILQRRTQIVQIEAGVKGSTFAKASFSLSTNRNDIDIDDPQFWQKWAKKADLNADELLQSKENLIIELPRQRRQVHRYGKQDATVNLSDLDTSGSEDEDEDPNGGGGASGGGSGGGGGSSKNKRRKRGRQNRDDVDVPVSFGGANRYTRSDCFNVEKGLLVYGWGRWADILKFEPFKRQLEVDDMKIISRAMLLCCLQHYDGDDRIKMFIYDLISPEDGQERNYKNHSGLSAPVPRGRKGRKSGKKLEGMPKKSQFGADLSKLDIDIDGILVDTNYKKHLKRHANKVLLRVRLLYYLKQEIVGDEAEKILNGAPASDVSMPIPPVDGDFPVFWWDREADKCMLIGVFKHGYEKYSLMRQDPGLCFLARCGPPDGAALLSEQDNEDDIREENDEDEQESQSRAKKDALDDLEDSQPDPDKVTMTTDTTSVLENGSQPFPSVSDLNARLRRLITAFQKSHKRELLRQEQIEKRMQKRELCGIILKEKEQARIAAQQKYVNQSHLNSLNPPPPGSVRSHLAASQANNARWSRREEADFYRVVSTFGVERNPSTGELQWETFRSLAHLDKKYDETLSEYFRAFYHMCLTVCRRLPTDGPAPPPASLTVEPITEERANRCLARIELLCKIREQILLNPHLDERLALCQPSPEMPDWWKCVIHDKELLIGATRHGLSRTECHILGDPQLSFSQHVASATGNDHPNQGNNEDGGTENHSDKLSGDFSDFSAVKTKEEHSVMADVAISLKLEPSKSLDSAPESATSTEVKSETKDTISAMDCEVKQDVETVSDDAVDLKDRESLFPKDEETASLKNDGEAASPKERETVSQDDDETISLKDNAECSEAMSLEDEIPRNLTSAKAEFSDDMEKPKLEEDGAMEVDVAEDGVLNLATVKRQDLVGAARKTEAEETPGKEDEEKSKAFEVEKKVVESKNEGGEGKRGEGKSDEMEKIRTSGPDSPLGEDGVSAMDTTLDGTGLMFSASQNHWPKDRVIFHRLENICQCVEKGEWPVNHRYFLSCQMVQCDSQSSTPVPDTPATGSSTPVQTIDYSLPPSSERLMEGVTMGFQKRRHRRTKAEMEADRVARLRGLLVASRVSPGETELDGLALQGALVQKMIEDRATLGDEDSATSSNEVVREPDWVNILKRKRRGRRSKVDKLLERQALEAFGQRSMLTSGWSSPATGIDYSQHQVAPVALTTADKLHPQPPPPSTDEKPPVARDDHHKNAIAAGSGKAEKRKPEKEVEGSVATPPAAPLTTIASSTPERASSRQHPQQMSEDEEMSSGQFGGCSSVEQLKERMLQNFLLSQAQLASTSSSAAEDLRTQEDRLQAELQQVMNQRQRRRPRLDPTKIEISDVTGYENVSVIDRANGKRITGAKAPPLRHLKDWLISNPSYDVDPKWSHIVRAKGNLPEELQSRIIRPSGRGRRSMASIIGLAPTPPAPPPVSQADFLTSMTNLQAMAATSSLMGYPNLSYPGLSNLALASQMLTTPGLGLLQGIGKPDLEAARNDGCGPEKAEKSDRKKAIEKSSSASKDDPMDFGGLGTLFSGIHPSFPIGFYNSMLMNSLIAQNLAAAAAGFSLPTALPSPFPMVGSLPLGNVRTLEGNPDETHANDSKKPAPSGRRHKASSARATQSTATVTQVEPEDLSTQTKAPPPVVRVRRHDVMPDRSTATKAVGDDDLVQDLSVEKKAVTSASDLTLRAPPLPPSTSSTSQGTSASSSVGTVAVTMPTTPVRSQNRRSKAGLLDSISSKLMAQKLEHASKKSEPLSERTTEDEEKPAPSS